MLSRRQLLTRGLAGLAAVPLLGRRALASPFGSFPAAYAASALPAELRVDNVLEVFLYGGLSPWETFYWVSEYGRPDDPDHPSTQTHAFSELGPESIRAALTSCSFPEGEALSLPFAQDALGMNVHLGPFAHPLWARTDLTSRMRLLVTQHDLEPHEAAIPLAITGKRLGHPAQAGLGAHIQRYFRDQALRRTPYGYVFSINSSNRDNIFLAAAATGLHPATARPLRIKVDAADRLFESLSRPSAGSPAQRAHYDALLSHYAERYRRRLRWPGEETALRSPRFTELEQGVASVKEADAVAQVLDRTLLRASQGEECGDVSPRDYTLASLRLASHLLTHPVEPARYVCVVDAGLRTTVGGGGYDSHAFNSHDTARNFKHLLEGLLGIINRPGEDDPTKLDLDRTLVILNTEFGRTPWTQGGTGRNHHPYGYVTSFIGGPIRAGEQGIVGAIDPSGTAVSAVTPAENRIGALLALGIWPFASEAFGVSDVQDVFEEQAAVESATRRLLGWSR